MMCVLNETMLVSYSCDFNDDEGEVQSVFEVYDLENKLYLRE